MQAIRPGGEAAPPSGPEAMIARIVDAIDHQGWSVTEGFLEAKQAEVLADESRDAWNNGAFRRAGVGRGTQLAIREDIRRDHVLWLQPGEITAQQQAWLGRLEPLRLSLNQRFFLGLFDYEGHFAVYPPGAFYQPHLDRHRATADRLVTVILYLNRDWAPDDGGALRLWTTPGKKAGPHELVTPRLGTLVCFLSGDFWHEVLPARRERMSITGWFRRRE